MTLKLFGHDPSPFVRRVRVLMTELGLSFERDASGWQQPTAEFTRASPIQRLPMLDRGPGAKVRYVYDSRVIAEAAYDIARATQARPVSGAPTIQSTLFDPAQEDDDKNVFSTIDAALESASNRYLLEQDGITIDESPYMRRQEDRVHACLAWLDARYAGRSTLAPSALAFVDISLVSMLGWLRFRDRANVALYPNLCAVEAAHAARPSFASTRPA